ncbi:putative M18 family aminopeptidase 2 [Candidatus Rhabdochlamydia oedothoracis]|uniref:M18 family aminopeptidase n=1 Tax=Candidatus Rhabdochlamydia oedothoracis TaxID=2720720 RepID=A0ABX8V808_9BACT|nr:MULTISPECIES: M18 family aminopeptidase [Rhabdochlamydia]KAG6559114.1 putative M18 family aminopeptidase 2 [Candidatus Rhabdochlamydia sp. W815]MCL6756239.1 M18 family aminopeptidase [Candidatus Rhabdochlamydia oedothoracis]QYF49165.1 putative M18 family aminopeptidase 2 [Candidatus Rhabdochlamydia oedothoracis]
MTHILADLKVFLETAPTSWHAVQEIGNRLAIHNFLPLEEIDKWKLKPGGKYFTIRGGSLCAFSLPKNPPKQALILASHTDSCALKLKPLPSYLKQNMTSFGVEVYGSPLLSSWLNRDLVLAGRVVILNKDQQPEENLVILDDATFIIPQLALHLDREVNEKGVILNKQEHLCPLVSVSSQEKNILEKLLKRQLSFEKLLSFDLFLVPQEPARFIGLNNEMLASYRIDNLVSAHAALAALVYCKKPSLSQLQIALFWDHEEIGSYSVEGAGSSFLQDILQRISYHLRLDVEALTRMKNSSLCLSIDMAHALNPNYIDKHDSQHQPLLNKGIVIKYNANQKYASQAISVAPIVHACHNLNLNYQSFLSRSDLPCGSTIGPIMAANLGIDTIDIGCPQLSMHSTRELIACQDYLDLLHLLSYLVQEGS